MQNKTHLLLHQDSELALNMPRRVLYASSQSYVRGQLEQVFNQENARSVEVLGCDRLDQLAATATASDICGRFESD